MQVRSRKAAWWVAVCLIGSALTGCGSADASGVNAGAAAPIALPVTGELDTRCADPTSDTAGVNVTDVALVSQDDQLIVAFTFNVPVSTLSELILTIEAHSEDGTVARQLGIQVFNGRPVASFIATSPDSEPTRLYDTVHVINNEVHAAFPLDTLTTLGPRWNWFAMAGDTESVNDYCPGAASTDLDNITPISVE
jgi:hypothetical protein